MIPLIHSMWHPLHSAMWLFESSHQILIDNHCAKQCVNFEFETHSLKLTTIAHSNVSIFNSSPDAAKPQQLSKEDYLSNKSRSAAMSFQSAFREICIPRKDEENGQGGLRLGAA